MIKRITCPKCGGSMTLYEGEDEFSTNELHPYSQLICKSCCHIIHDWEDEFYDLGGYDLKSEVKP